MERQSLGAFSLRGESDTIFATIKMSETINHRPVLTELLKQKQSEAFGVLKYYEAAVTVYLLISGGLLKFALDVNSTEQLKQALSVMGISICGVGFLAVALAEHHRRTLQSELRRLFDALQVPLPADNLRAQKYGLLSALLIFIIGCTGWIFLLKSG